jgi:hypothetical protein
LTSDHLNALFVRCEACSKVVDWSEEGVCDCAATLPEPPAYWLVPALRLAMR